MLSKIFKDVVLKKPVQSSMIFVRLGQGLFKSDYITRYLHTWVVLRLCIIYTIGESPCICSKYSHLYYHLLIWGRAKVSRSRSNYFSSIAIELLLQDGQRKLCGLSWFDRDRSIAIELLCSRRTTRPNIPFLYTYYAHYVYSVIRISVCEPGHSKTYAVTFASIEDSDQPSHPTVWTGSSQCALLNHVLHTLYLSHACEEFELICHMFASMTYT